MVKGQVKHRVTMCAPNSPLYEFGCCRRHIDQRDAAVFVCQKKQVAVQVALRLPVPRMKWTIKNTRGENPR
jgi:hypothetical protein